MLVRQMYAGWVGMVSNGRCANMSINFPINSSQTDKQLERISTATHRELVNLLQGIEEQPPFPQQEEMVDYLMKRLNYK